MEHVARQGDEKWTKYNGDQDNTSKTWTDHEEMDRRHQRKNGQMMDAGGTEQIRIEGRGAFKSG